MTRKEKLYAENISKIGEQSISGPAKSAIFKDSEKYRCFRSGKQEAGQSEKEGPLTSKQKLRGFVVSAAFSRLFHSRRTENIRVTLADLSLPVVIPSDRPGAFLTWCDRTRRGGMFMSTFLIQAPPMVGLRPA